MASTPVPPAYASPTRCSRSVACLARGRTLASVCGRTSVGFGREFLVLPPTPARTEAVLTGSEVGKPSSAGSPRRLLAATYRSALSRRWLVHLAQWAVTGERTARRLAFLGDEVAAGGDRFVVDLGCGEAPLLGYIDPETYVGIDSHEPSLAEARRLHGGPGREFVRADLDAVDYSRWEGADVVTLASVTHHLADDAVFSLLGRVADEVRPGRILISDAEPSGVLGPLVRVLDDGDHFRSRAQLAALVEPRFGYRLGRSYKNRFRSFHYFLLDLRPRA